MHHLVLHGVIAAAMNNGLTSDELLYMGIQWRESPPGYLSFYCLSYV